MCVPSLFSPIFFSGGAVASDILLTTDLVYLSSVLVHNLFSLEAFRAGVVFTLRFVARACGPVALVVLLTLLEVGGLDFQPYHDQGCLLRGMWPDTHGTLRKPTFGWGIGRPRPDLIEVRISLALAGRPFPRSGVASTGRLLVV